MNFENISIGTDIERIERFENKSRENDTHFLNKLFTEKELEYCFKYKFPKQHLCARFCAKEAVVKALTDFSITNVYYSDIEILNHENGMPYCRILKYPDIKIKITLSHTKDYATATAMCFKDK